MTISYTRAGQFGVDSSGYITNSNGQYLQTFPVDALGNVTSTSLNTTLPIQLPASTGAPQATTEIEIGLNINASSTALDPTAFDPTSSTTFNHSTSTTVFDSLGASHVMTYYFVHDLPGSATNGANDPNQWVVFNYLDGAEIDIAGGTSITHTNNTVAVTQRAAIMNFNTNGTFASTTPAVVQNTAIPLTNGASSLTILHDFANNVMTQYSADFAVNTLDPSGFSTTSSATFNHSTSTTVFDSLGATHVMTYYFVHDLPGSATNAANDPSGFSTGRLTEIDISEEGLIRATFSNGVSTPMGQIALAEFPNNQGLQNLGSSNWTETIDSGSVITGIAGSGRFGLVQSGALETANVDLTAQLVNLITVQRNFQANARSIETSNAITDTIIQIR